MKTIEGRSADAIWNSAARLFEEKKFRDIQNSRCGPCIDIGRVALILHDPRQRWVLSRVPAINPAFALAECIWILSGRNDLAFPRYFNSQYPKYVGDDEEVYGAYGFRLRQNLGIDQIGRAYNALRSDASSRQVVLQIWDGTKDLPFPSGEPRSKDIPCNLVSLLKVRDDSLEWTQIVRSNDVFLGLPYNLIQFTTIHEVLSGWLGLRMGSYCHITDSLHCYETHFNQVISADRRTVPPNSDSMMLTKEVFDEQLMQLVQRLDKMIQPALKQSDFLGLMDWSECSPSFRNVLFVLGAECSRRRNWRLENDLIKQCTNDVYKMAFESWVFTISKQKSE